MGAIECCEALDPQLKVSLNERRSFILENTKGHTNLVSEFFMFKSKVQLYGDVFMKKGLDKTEFILQVFSSVRSSDVVNLPARIFEESPSLSQQRQSVTLQTPISDPSEPQKMFFMVKDKAKVKLIYKLTPFSRYEEQKFKRYVYEVSMHRRVTLLKCPFIHSLLEDYIIESGIDKENNDKCAFMIGDQSLATLHQIVTFRKHSNWQWTEGEFQAIMSQMIQAVSALHRNKITHRDIRPHNIFYSGSKGIFMLSGFQLSKVVSGKPNETHSIVGVPYFTIPQLKRYMSENNFTDFVSYDCMAADVYSLGVTLATTFFLEPTLPDVLLVPSLLKYEQQYPFLRQILTMIRTPNTAMGSLIQNINRGPERRLREENLIESLRYKLKPQDEEFVSQRRAIAMGYYHIFMYEKWANEINQVVNYFQLKGDKVQLAETYKIMADIYSEHKQQQSVNDYNFKASNLFCDLGQESIKDQRLDDAVGFLEKGIECNRKARGGADNYELALLLNKLAMVHHKKDQIEVARAFQQEATDIVGKTKGQNSLEYSRMLLDSARIQGDFQQFKLAQNMLKAALKIVEPRCQEVGVLQLKVNLLEALGNNYRMKAIQRRDKSDQYRDKAQECLIDALQISQKLDGNGGVQIASILQSLGNIYFDKRDFHKAKKTYERALIIKKHCLKPDSLEAGQTLTYIANCYKSLKEYENAIQHYDQAVQIFRGHYGNDHNANTAVAIGNIGIVYKDIGRVKEAREYLTLGKSILKDLYGQSSPDYQYFNRQI